MPQSESALSLPEIFNHISKVATNIDSGIKQSPKNRVYWSYQAAALIKDIWHPGQNGTLGTVETNLIDIK